MEDLTFEQRMELLDLDDRVEIKKSYSRPYVDYNQDPFAFDYTKKELKTEIEKLLFIDKDKLSPFERLLLLIMRQGAVTKDTETGDIIPRFPPDSIDFLSDGERVCVSVERGITNSHKMFYSPFSLDGDFAKIMIYSIALGRGHTRRLQKNLHFSEDYRIFEDARRLLGEEKAINLIFRGVQYLKW